jgi:hypothetical protein
LTKVTLPFYIQIPNRERGFVELADRRVTYKELDEWLHGRSANIFYSISACHSSSALPIMGKEGRVIITPCGADESGVTAALLFFLYYNYDIVEMLGYDDAPSRNGAFARKEL